MARAKEAAAEAVTAAAVPVDSSTAAAISPASPSRGGSSSAAAAPTGTAEKQSASSSGSDSGATKKSSLSGCAEAVAQLPGAVRFALAVVLSFALSELGRLAVDRVSEGELGGILRAAASRTGREGFVLVAWRLYVVFSPLFFGFLPLGFRWFGRSVSRSLAGARWLQPIFCPISPSFPASG
jgi:hypothetical protein